MLIYEGDFLVLDDNEPRFDGNGISIIEWLVILKVDHDDREIIPRIYANMPCHFWIWMKFIWFLGAIFCVWDLRLAFVD